MSDILMDFTASEFDSQVVGSDKPVLVDFWAPWCGPCKAMTPMIEKLAGEYEGRVLIGKMDIQAHPKTAGTLGIRGIPTLLFFKDGKVVGSLGASKEDKIREQLDSILE